MIGVMRISKRQFYDMGGFSDTRNWRRMVGGKWQYFRIVWM